MHKGKRLFPLLCGLLKSERSGHKRSEELAESDVHNPLNANTVTRSHEVLGVC